MLGIDTGSYSFPYVARWAHGKSDLVHATAARVIGTARTITASLTVS